MPIVADLTDNYLAQRLALHELTPLTARNHRSALSTFSRSCGRRPVERLSPRDVERWLATRHHLAPATRRSQFSYIRSFCSWLVKRRYVRTDPTADVKAPRLPRSVPRALPRDDIGRLLAACPDERGRAIVWLMVGMGLRCVEVARLEVGDWDRAVGVMVVEGKGRHQRALPVPLDVEAAVGAYLHRHPATAGPLIRSYRVPPEALHADTISGMVSEWMALAGIKRLPRDGVSAHALRHTAASDVLEHCHDLRVVQAMLGHQHLSSTSVYLRRAAIGQMREAMDGRTYVT